MCTLQMSNTVGALYSRERPQTYRNWLRTTQPVAESTLRYWNAKRQCLQSRSNKEDDGVNWKELGNLSDEGSTIRNEVDACV